MPATHLATAFLLHGYLGAGKTTFARRLEIQHAAIRFTHDEWMRALYSEDPPADDFAEYALRVSGVMERTWVRCLEVGIDVVLDFGFWSRAERDRVRELIVSIPACFQLYRHSCPDDVAWQRIERRNSDLATDLFIAPNTFQFLKSHFEPLGADEVRTEVPYDIDA